MATEIGAKVARRRFMMLDAMIAIAALATEFGLIRALGLGFDREFHSKMWTQPDWFFRSWAIDQLIDQLFQLATTAALTSTLAVLVFRLRRPRPPWRRLAGQPGMTAALTVVAAWMTLGPYLATMIFDSPEPYVVQIWGIITPWAVPVLAGFGVATSWGMQALSHRWRAESSWIDRLGRIVGVGWMALALWGIYLGTIF